MARLEDMLESNYIQKTDLKQPTRLTVAGCERKDVGQEGKPEMKWVVSFDGGWKPLILNVTNTNAFFGTLGDDSDEWRGKQIVLFNDQSVEYQGKRGGIRVYQQMEVADAAPPQSQFDQNNNLNPPVEDTTDYTPNDNFSN